jgi:hypothetical protein
VKPLTAEETDVLRALAMPGHPIVNAMSTEGRHIIPILDALVARGCASRTITEPASGMIVHAYDITGTGRLALRVSVPHAVSFP